MRWFFREISRAFTDYGNTEREMLEHEALARRSREKRWHAFLFGQQEPERPNDKRSKRSGFTQLFGPH
jgi:hypothetical protein